MAGTFDPSIDNQQVVIAGHRFVASGATANAGKLTFTITPAKHGPWQAGLAVQRLRATALAGSTELSVNGAQKLYTGAIVELDNGTDKEFHTVMSVSGTVVTLTPSWPKATSRPTGSGSSRPRCWPATRQPAVS